MEKGRSEEVTGVRKKVYFMRKKALASTQKYILGLSAPGCAHL